MLDTPGALTIAFQPIVDIHAGGIVGHEALSRITAGTFGGPLPWFTAARRTGLAVALETKACIAALRSIPRIPEDQFISVNLSPEALMSDAVRGHLNAVDPARVVLELTEEADAPDLSTQTAHIDELRRRGMRLAIDDIGAGYSSISRILHLQPDFLKVDRGLVQGCATDPMRRYVLEVFASLAQKQGGEVVAEGVEDREDLDVVHQIGIRYVQGYLLGRAKSQPAELTREERCCLDIIADRPLVIELGAAAVPARLPAEPAEGRAAYR
ncbi:MAG TPA: EAL domain-containing protein [Euzebya sp.]|nr:EAL domain-containing protein [Euzebya sp.]